MRAFICSVVLFIIIIGGVIGNAFYVSFVADRLEQYADRLKNNKSPTNTLEELWDFWNMHRKFTAISVETKELDAIEKIILTLELSAETGAEFEFENCRRLLKEAATELSRLERLSMESIF